MRKTVYLVVITLSVFSFYCGIDAARVPVKQFSNYTLRQDLPLHERVAPAPKVVLDFWMEMDGRKDYSTYMPDSREMSDIRKSLENLPPLHKKVLKQRLIGIYFINNFLGSGGADWVADGKKKLYFYLVINPKILKMKDLSEMLTWRERSCFIDGSDVRISVNCGSGASQLTYIMLHEGAHIVDYAVRITPYAEKEVKDFYSDHRDDTDFVRGIWKSIREPIKSYAYRKDLTFYGFNNGPRLKASDAPEIYRGLAGSPFVSLYGSQSWAEDLADFVTFYHVTQKMKLPYVISVIVKGKEAVHYRPMDNPDVKKRFRLMDRFYGNK
ncbi:MAG TPA: hypothetical protein PLC28_21035 [Spirochaetota bacterium]|nr:hypothetical protein [Spirochaetota bacterium]HPC43476.1 hypothetical protein [Spirochaetota bacterium]HPL17913.1 hypothetical protein [Spirochaetota bacterium]HQJ73202.1 hypothetical protein [Spirochaetota bacterium]HRS79322.1 hypothetical protein [Spirochaetota bacterium]